MYTDMKKILYFISALLSLPIAIGCSQHDIPLYEGKDAIYFDQQYGVSWFDSIRQSHQIYSLIPFGSMLINDTLLNVKVETAGYMKDYDRPFKIEIVADSTDAIEGQDFEILTMNPVIKAGQNSAIIPIMCHRSEHVKKDTYQLQIRLIPGEHFVLPFGEKGIGEMPLRKDGGDIFVEYSTNADPSIHNIFISGLYQQPKFWITPQFGLYFSQSKFSLILKVAEEKFGWDVRDFESQKMIDRAPLLVKHVSEYLNGEYRKGREHWVIDDNGTMMWVKGCYWYEGQDPDKFN